MQQALLEAPSAFSAVATYRVSGYVPRGAAMAAVRDVMRRLASRGGVSGLVAVHPRWLEQSVELPPVLPRSGLGGTFPSTQGDLFVQVSADSREGLFWGLEQVKQLWSFGFTLDEELQGGKIGDGRDVFGFRDVPVPPTPDEIRTIARIGSGSLVGGTWLLYQRYVQDVEHFGRLSTTDQEETFGVKPDGTLLDAPPPDSHVGLTRERDLPTESRFVRRGFPYRANGESGLAFIAASAVPSSFTRSLDLMLGASGEADRLLRYARAIGGGVYYALPAT